MHVRQQVRDKIAAACIASNVVGAKVFTSRIYALRPADVPSIVVYTENEKISIKTPARNQPRLQERRIFTAVYVVVTANDATEQELDDISVLVEDEIFKDPRLGGVAIETSLVSAEKFLSSQADKDVGVLKLVLDTMVLTQEGNASANI